MAEGKNLTFARQADDCHQSPGRPLAAGEAR